MKIATPRHVPAEEYLRAEEDHDWRREWSDGAVFEMPRSSIEHGRLGANMCAVVNRIVKGKGRAFASGAKIFIEPAQLWTYADLSVVFGPLECKKVRLDQKLVVEAIANPGLIVEILAEETERYDRTTKFQAYQTLPSFREYVLISQDEPRVEVYRRDDQGRWTVEVGCAGKTVKIYDARVEVDDVYA